MNNINSACNVIPKILKEDIAMNNKKGSNTLKSMSKNSMIKNSKLDLLNYNQIKDIYSDVCNFSLQEYDVYFYTSQYEMYKNIIHSMINAYKSIIGKPHIICSNMELSPLDETFVIPDVKNNKTQDTKPPDSKTKNAKPQDSKTKNAKPQDSKTKNDKPQDAKTKDNSKDSDVKKYKTIKSILDYYKSKDIIDITYLSSNIYGATLSYDVEKCIKNTSNTCLLIVPFVNHMIGTVNNVKLIGEIAHRYNIPFLCNCSYIFGKYPINPAVNNIDIFTTDLCVTTALLAIKKDVVSGYKLSTYSMNFNDNMDMINMDSNSLKILEYIKKILIECKKKMLHYEINNNKILELKNYLIKLLQNKKVVCYYDNIVKSGIQNNPGDIIILGPSTNDITKVIPHVISFIYLGNIKPKQKQELTYSNGNPGIFYNIGITKKFLQKIITLSLENTSKKCIKDFVDLL